MINTEEYISPIKFCDETDSFFPTKFGREDQKVGAWYYNWTKSIMVIDMNFYGPKASYKKPDSWNRSQYLGDEIILN